MLLKPDISWSTQRAFDQRTVYAYAIIVVVIVMVSAAIAFSTFEFSGDGLFSRAGMLVGMALCGILARGYGFERLSAICQSFAVMAGFTLPAFLAIAVLASSNFPLIDKYLIYIDGFFKFEWINLYKNLFHFEYLYRYGERVYVSLQWQPTILLFILSILMKHIHLWRFISAWFIALMITMVIFPFTPAVGGFIHYGIGNEQLPHLSEASISGWYGIFEGLRTGTISKLGANTVTGIVTFPSFHAAGAVLLGYGFMAVAWLRWPMLLLNIGVFFSSIVIGGHYLVDVIAGGLIAAASIWIAHRLPYLRDNPKPSTSS